MVVELEDRTTRVALFVVLAATIYMCEGQAHRPDTTTTTTNPDETFFNCCEDHELDAYYLAGTATPCNYSDMGLKGNSVNESAAFKDKKEWAKYLNCMRGERDSMQCCFDFARPKVQR